MIKFITTQDNANADGTLFLIPSYQRGYRWQKEDVQKLLRDLATFSGTDYCLQPLELQEAERPQDLVNVNDKRFIRVVDGQQRLTTITIIADLLGIKNLNWKIYYLVEKKYLSDLLSTDDQEQTINAHFRYEVEQEVEQTVKEFSQKERLEKYFSEDKNIVFPTHFLPPDNNGEEENDKGQKAFNRLNAGKTPLTSSELIRALYMVNDSGLDEQQRMEISKEWELIENTLANEQFWQMFNAVGLEKTPTRIDLLFALVLGIDLQTAKINPRCIYEKLETGFYNEEIDLTKVWEEILRCFWWMQSCYEDIECFNYLGWLAKCTYTQASTVFKDHLELPTMEKFKKAVIKRILDTGICYISMRYGEPRLKDFLLLCNALECNHRKERLHFELLGANDIEHIDSQTPNDLSNLEDRKTWLESVYAEYGDLGTGYSKEVFCSLPVNDTQCIIKKIVAINGDNSVMDGNGLGNLVLLDASINRAYKNAVFPEKRKKIIEAIVQGKHYLLPCTEMAFMKFYTKDATRMDRWLQQDFDGYQKAMLALLEDIFKEKDFHLPAHSVKLDLAPDVETTLKEKTEMADNPSNPPLLSGEITFEKLLNTYVIRIPKIQRTYVQGRQDSYGKKCLKDFATVLVDSVCKGTACPLDMIYGIASGNVFYPLDGQQRLTTLLLLSWLCGKTQNKQWMFDYESRRASEIFIRNLLTTPPPVFTGTETPDIPKGKDYPSLCTSYLAGQAWFLPFWQNDPGIAGILEMLDSLYWKLQKSTTGQSEYCFDKITFTINRLAVTAKEYDHIFLKMNSRGRQLTTWENVKAVLDKYVPANGSNWKENINLTWPEAIWPKVNKDINRLDSNMLSVIGEALKYAGYKEKSDDTFQLDNWMNDNADEVLKFFACADTLLSSTTVTEDLHKALTPSWEKNPQLPDFREINSECRKRLAAYYAAIKSTNADWMRVIWNIVENSDTGSNLPGALHLIDELSSHSNDILAFLASEDKINSGFAKEQLLEERLKASLCTDEHWHSQIKKAEALPFLKGHLTVILEASGQELGPFTQIFGVCTEKNSTDEMKVSAFKDYLSYAQNCDLPMVFDKGNFFSPATWKSMFFTNPRKNGVIDWFRSFVGENKAQNPVDWATNLQEHWDDICCYSPKEYQKIAMYSHGWGNDKVFLYRTSNITRAQLLSPSHRPNLLTRLNNTASPWRYEDYNVSIKLGNGMTLYHTPDDVISLNQDNNPIKTIGEFSLPLKLTDENFDEVVSAIQKLKEINVNC